MSGGLQRTGLEILKFVHGSASCPMFYVVFLTVLGLKTKEGAHACSSQCGPKIKFLNRDRHAPTWRTMSRALSGLVPGRPMPTSNYHQTSIIMHYHSQCGTMDIFVRCYSTIPCITNTSIVTVYILIYMNIAF